jgi:hypothetical protein
VSGDPTYIINDASSIAQIVILVLGVYRALVMRRGFVDATYRSRALWSAFLMLVIAVTNAQFFFSFPNDVLGTVLGFAPFIAIIIVSFAFVDRSMLVAVRSDFFHRNPLHWLQLRIPASVVLVGSAALIFAAVTVSAQLANSGPGTNAPIWADLSYYQFFVVVVLILGYAAIGLIVAARRTPDKTLRRSIRLLGLALGSFVVSIVLSTIIPGDAGSILGDVFTLLATYVLYLSAMSLTTLGRVEKDAQAASR